MGCCFGFRPGRGFGGMTHGFDAMGAEKVRGSQEERVRKYLWHKGWPRAGEWGVGRT